MFVELRHVWMIWLDNDSGFGTREECVRCPSDPAAASLGTRSYLTRPFRAGKRPRFLKHGAAGVGAEQCVSGKRDIWPAASDSKSALTALLRSIYASWLQVPCRCSPRVICLPRPRALTGRPPPPSASLDPKPFFLILRQGERIWGVTSFQPFGTE